MPYYVVKAIDDEGREITKEVEADNEVQLASFLEFLNVTPIKISQKPEFVGNLSKALKLRRIKRKDLIDLFENLHLIAQSGVPLGTGIWDLAEDMENPAMKDMLHDIGYRVQTGMSISSAMEKYESVLGAIAINLVRIGEETGSLDRVFKDIAEHYSRIEDFKSKVKQALIYPAFALVTISFALIFWLVFVLPKLADLFKGLNVELPTITKVVMKVSLFVQDYIVMLIVGFVAFLVGVILLRKKNEKFRYQTDKLLLKTPIIKMILTTFNYAFFSEYMRLMITAGVSIYETFNVLQNSFSNRVFKKAMEFLKKHVEGGGTISGGMRQTQLFPPLMVRMIAVGEETGGLDDQLNYLAQYYYNKLDYITQNIAKIIEPLIIIVVGFFMAVIMISLLMPIYDLVSKMGQM